VAAAGVVLFEHGVENESDASHRWEGEAAPQCARMETSRPLNPFVMGTPAGIFTL
jgi:hypothetical protein